MDIKMSWGTELWDQYDNLALHTQKGIDFLERYGHYIRDRCSIELDYATKLRRLVKGYHSKKKEEEDYQFSVNKAFKQMLNEVNDQAGQHELIAENLQETVNKEVITLVKDFKEERKKYLHDGAKTQANLAQHVASLDRAKKNYEKAFKESEKALESYQRADADLNLSRAEVEKQRMNSSMKSQHCEDSKNEYANQLQKTNELQILHFQTLIPTIFQQLQEMDEKRIKCLRNYMKQSAETERRIFPILNRCFDGIVTASEGIDEKNDSILVIEKFKSGYQPPSEIPFEDLSAVKNGDVIPMTSIMSSPSYLKPESLTVKGTLSAGKLKKRGGLFGIFSSNKNHLHSILDFKDDFGDLPPNQRRKKLQQKIDEISAKVQQENAARDGLMKMKDVYEQNSALGDPMSIEGQLTENSQRLEKLHAELNKYQTYLDELDGRSTTLPATSSNNYIERKNSLYHHQSFITNGTRSAGNSHRNSDGSDESLSRSASDLSVSNQNNKASAPGTPLPSHGSSNSPESGFGTSSHTSLPDSDPEHHEYEPHYEGANGDYYDLEPLPVLGTCRAMYSFEATSEGSIPLSDSEELFIIETDQGDGWTRVRRKSNSLEEGFVPTSYIECHLYSS